ncbi:MAG: alkaline phosphatase PhoX [Candidatus Poseidoniales archaeon]
MTAMYRHACPKSLVLVALMLLMTQAGGLNEFNDSKNEQNSILDQFIDPQSASHDGSSTNLTESMTRIMMFPPSAEVTGMHIDANGNFFVNAMHPDDDNYKATIGVINGIDWNDLPDSVPELASSSSESDIWHGIRTSYGDYQVLLQSGDALSGGEVAGGIYATDDGNQLFTSEKPDYNAFVPLNPDGTQGYLYTAWEERPAGISRMEIEWNAASGEWNVLGGMMLDLGSVNGGWVFCFGSMSPWGTPLLAEELYFSNTVSWNDQTHNYHQDQERLEDYLGYYPNPYDYGYIMEIENSATFDPDFTKHFAMGRFSHENAQVMPDEKTVYLSDDGYDTVLFKFVADTAGDLSSGTLFAARAIQDDSSDSATTGFDVEWIEMASSSNSEIQTWIDEYDGITTADFTNGQNSYISDEEITDWAEGRLNDDLNGDGTIGSAADDRVAFLESRKAAAALGASDEWTKMEGVGFNPNAPDYLYLAMSDVRYDMSDGQGDIDVTQNRCGIVYRLTLDDEWNVNRIEPAISGGPYTSSATYECDVNNLAGPDNLVVLDDGRVLVGEDTGKHESNMVWLWEPVVAPEIVNEEVVAGGETITVGVVKVSIPENPELEWDSKYLTAVNGLQMDVNYTALINIYRIDDMWEGIDWRWDIDWEGGYDTDGDGYHNQSENPFSLQGGCYHINADLYESGALHSNEDSAVVLASADLDFDVGGTCTDGVFYPVVVDDEGPAKDREKGETTSIPGFGVFLAITAALGAAVVARWE